MVACYLEHLKQIIERLGHGYKHGRPKQFAKGCPLLGIALGQLGEQILAVEHADDVVAIGVVDGDARVARFDDVGNDFIPRRIGLHHVHVGPRGHDLRHIVPA